MEGSKARFFSLRHEIAIMIFCCMVNGPHKILKFTLVLYFRLKYFCESPCLRQINHFKWKEEEKYNHQYYLANKNLKSRD